MRKILSVLVIVSASAWATPSSPLLPESDGARVSVPISARSEQRSVKKTCVSDQVYEKLFSAALGKNLGEMRALFEQYEIDVDKTDDHGWSFLLCVSCGSAAQNENIGTAVKYLVDQGANVNTQNEKGESALLFACSNGNESVVKYLVEHNAKIDIENDTEETPLFFACASGDENIVKYLTEKGANIDKGNTFGETPLFWACRNGNVKTVKYLIEIGANINKADNEGNTPLMEAVQEGQFEVISLLLDQAKPGSEMTLLLAYKSESQLSTEDVFSGRNSLEFNVNARNNVGHTVLDLVLEEEQKILNFNLDSENLKKWRTVEKRLLELGARTGAEIDQKKNSESK